MIRTIAGYSIVAIAGLVAVKLVFKLIGFAFSIFMSILWLVAILGLAYFVLKVVKAAMADSSRAPSAEVEVEVGVEESTSEDEETDK